MAVRGIKSHLDTAQISPVLTQRIIIMVVVNGTVSAGYEPVREAFRQQLVDGRAENAQVRYQCL